MSADNPYNPPDADGELPSEFAGAELSEEVFYNDSQRRYHMLSYIFFKTDEDGLLDEIEALGEKLDAAEEQHLPEFYAFEARAMEVLLVKFPLPDFLGFEVKNPEVKDIQTRFFYQYMLNKVDGLDEHMDALEETAQAFQNDLGRDYDRAMELSGESLRYWEDLFMADYDDMMDDAEEGESPDATEPPPTDA